MRRKTLLGRLWGVTAYQMIYVPKKALCFSVRMKFIDLYFLCKNFIPTHEEKLLGVFNI